MVEIDFYLVQNIGEKEELRMIHIIRENRDRKS